MDFYFYKQKTKHLFIELRFEHIDFLFHFHILPFIIIIQNDQYKNNGLQGSTSRWRLKKQ